MINALVDSGAEELSRHGWIERQIHGPTAAEATEDLLRATTLRSARILMDQARGALDRELQIMDRYEAEGHPDKARGTAEALLRWADVGAHLIHPWRVVLCGPPNVGKSSLLNRLLGYDRAVVHDRAGTTRDLLAESTSIEGWPVILIDSAGIRRSTHEIEGQGIERAHRAIASADRLLLLVDPLQGWTMEHESIWRVASHRCLLIQTKADIPSLSMQRHPLPSEPLKVSAVSGEGVEGLMRAIAESLVAQLPPPGAAVPFRTEHIERLISMRARTGG
jgi:tRNA modification GTPase